MKRWIIAILTAGILALALGAITPHVIPGVLSRYRPDVRFAGTTTENEKRIFVTIDDAPSARTPEILHVLKKHNVPATFFVIADRVKSPQQLQDIVDAQHALGNHLRTTKPCSQLSLAEFKSDFDACARLLEPHRQKGWFRPPSDFGTAEQIAYAGSKGYTTVVGTMFPLDHWISNPRALALLARWLSTNGGILILHDGDVRGQTTAAVLDQLLPQLKKAGFSFGRLENKAARRTAKRNNEMSVLASRPLPR